LSGGEPLLREDIFELTACAASLGLRPVFGTTGTTITGAVAARLKGAGAARIGISLDSAAAPLHDAFRQVPGAFDSALSGMEACRRAGLPFQIHTTVMEHNYHEFEKITDLAVRMGAAGHHVFFLVPTGRGKDIEEEALREKRYEQLLHRILTGTSPLAEQLAAEPPRLLAEDEALRAEAIAHLARWGGMPALLPLDDEQRRDWLRSYQQTFLERDLADLVRMTDLQPFRTLQRLAMLRAGGLLSYAELARDAGIATTTARRYVEYLRLTYQVVLLHPYGRNLTSSTVKAPKLYWPDLGLVRHATQQWGELDGAQFENLAVAEIHKWIATLGVDARLSYYRTRGGREADLLVETPLGVIGMEIKKRAQAVSADASALRALRLQLEPAWRGGIVVTDGGQLRPLLPDEGIWAVPLHRLV